MYVSVTSPSMISLKFELKGPSKNAFSRVEIADARFLVISTTIPPKKNEAKEIRGDWVIEYAPSLKSLRLWIKRFKRKSSMLKTDNEHYRKLFFPQQPTQKAYCGHLRRMGPKSVLTCSLSFILFCRLIRFWDQKDIINFIFYCQQIVFL